MVGNLKNRYGNAFNKKKLLKFRLEVHELSYL